MTDRKVLTLVACAAPPVLRISELIGRLQQDGWTVCLTTTPTAATWIDREALTQQTGYPVRVEWRMPGDPEPHPPATAVAVVPATFNVINKWAQGINDTLALGILNEALGADIPVHAFPSVKDQLAAHPSYDRHLQTLRDAGVVVTPLRTEPRWEPVVAQLWAAYAPATLPVVDG
ncbi:flavoprotein [Micromonospora craterilacus]|uniref:Flavoprotein n=2 Tax=Micromonospora craterilacus TaxID=1655439 RepID=A0A2W2EZ03_9ACTN|nr:flavoprotein [Micromonospora craterilacus]